MLIMDRIEINSEVLHGKPVIAGTRIPVNMVVGLLSQGLTIEEIKKDYYTDLSTEDILACLKYVHNLSEKEEVYA